MQVFVVSYSKFGNTRLVADAVAGGIAERLGSGGSVEVITLEQLERAQLEGADLLVMGCPTHNMNLPKAIRPLLEALPRRSLRGAAAAAFDTSYKLSRWLVPFTAAPRLARRLRRLGGRLVAPPETFHVMEREGPLYDGELERAREWGHSLLLRFEGLVSSRGRRLFPAT